MLKVKLVRSMIGCNPKQRATVKALGLRKIRQEKSFEDTPIVRGMIKKVEHLVEVTES
ncbi:50S ribosomal protein L30 [Maridesulfovibrio sp.]|uniref:50S ribosomal protein L30 n=1 Tax=Maridesulfovibrio sp. TaxID=2795000 RepID=UPI0029F4A543|nr:50S ribosomal protein L30 [Maridesulfovibrio sp.]